MIDDVFAEAHALTTMDEAAFAWVRRAIEEGEAGRLCGIRELCPTCWRPIWEYADTDPHTKRAPCTCGTEHMFDSREAYIILHGLGATIGIDAWTINPQRGGRAD